MYKYPTLTEAFVSTTLPLLYAAAHTAQHGCATFANVELLTEAKVAMYALDAATGGFIHI